MNNVDLTRGIELLEQVSADLRERDDKRPSPWSLGHAQSMYNDLFWRPYLGQKAYALYGTLASWARAVAAGYVERPTVAMIQDAAGFADRGSVMGRAASGNHPRRDGYMQQLTTEMIVRIASSGKGFRRRYSFGVLLHLPILTPAQVQRITPRMRDVHERFLGALRGFDLPAWRTFEVETLVPDNVSQYDWVWLGQGKKQRPRTKETFNLTEGRKRSVLERDGHECRYCGDPADTVDHIIPQSQGGGHDMDNLVAACEPCNKRKGARTPEQSGMILRPLLD